MTKSIKEIKKFAKKFDIKIIDYKDYTNQQSKLVAKYKKCDFVWDTSWKNIQKMCICPNCYGSYGHRCLLKVAEILFPAADIFRDYSKYVWLKTTKTGRYRIDIVIMNKNKGWTLAIEYDGEQHFKPVKLYGGVAGFKRTQERDADKEKRIKEHPEDIQYFV